MKPDSVKNELSSWGHLRTLREATPNPWPGPYYEITIDPPTWPKLATFLKSLPVESLLNLTAFHQPQKEKAFRLSYELRSFLHGFEIRVVCEMTDPIAYSVASIYPAAEWHEREAYDMMGIIFLGHPALKRIFLPQDWHGYPLRKDYSFPTHYREIPL